MPPNQEENVNHAPVDAERITIGMKVMGGILVHAVMLVIFFMKLQSSGEKNAEAIMRNSERITKIESDLTLTVAGINAQIATINVRLAVLENQNAQAQRK